MRTPRMVTRRASRPRNRPRMARWAIMRSHVTTTKRRVAETPDRRTEKDEVVIVRTRVTAAGGVAVAETHVVEQLVGAEVNVAETVQAEERAASDVVAAPGSRPTQGRVAESV